CTSSMGVSGRTMARRCRISCWSSVSVWGLAACASTQPGMSVALRATTGDLAAETDVIGQLVDVIRPTRKEPRQRRADLPDGADPRRAESARTKPLDHPVAHSVPVLVADPGMNAVVANDRQLAILHGEIDEDTGPVRRPVHAERPENVTRALHGIGGPSTQP